MLVFLNSRVLLLGLGRVAAHALGSPHIRENASVLPARATPGWAHAWLAPWFRFDTGWYVGLAQHGYHWGALGKANTNFMPAYPALVRGFSDVTGLNAWLSALVAANAAALGALLLLWRWATRRWGRETAMRVLLLTAFFPFAFFLAVPYAEPLFLLVAVAAFVLADEDRWASAATMAGIAVVTRPVGTAVVLGLILLAVSKRNVRQAGIAALGILPLVAFTGYLWAHFGHPLAFLTYHSAGWVAPHGGPLEAIAGEFHTSLTPFDRIDAAAVIVFLASGVVTWRRVGLGYGAFILAGVLLPLAHGLVSMERYVTVLFPVFALWASWRSRVGQLILLGTSFLLFLIFSTMFAAGYSIF